MAALYNRAGHYIFALWFLLFSFFPRLISAVAKCAARGLLEMQDPKNCQKFAIWALSHNFVGLYLQLEKNLLNSNVSPTWSHNMVNFGPLAAEICCRVWGTPAHLSGFRVLVALLQGTLAVGVSQTLWH